MSRTTSVVLAALVAAGTPAYSGTTNPDTSVNVLGLYSQSKHQGEDKTEPGGGFALQSAELQFLSDVDPYLKATVVIGIHAETAAEHAAHDDEETPAAGAEAEAEADEANAEGEAHHAEYHVEPEEAFFETTQLPYVTIKAGKFKAALGRHNTLHTHAYPFVDQPMIHQLLLGDEGLADAGVSAAVLVPAPWFLEATAQVLQGNSEELFASESSSDVAQVYRLRNLFDLSDAATIDLGVSGAAGANAENERTKIGGADLAFKWRPTKGGKSAGLILAAEYLAREETKGYAGWTQVQVGERWWVQARNEAVSDDADLKSKRNAALLAFNPSEFSSFRLQFSRLDEGGEAKPLDSVQFQTSFTIGAHPAHAY